MRAKQDLIAIFAALLLSGCVGDKAENVHSAWPSPDGRDRERSVFYVTDRAPGGPDGQPGGPWGGYTKAWTGRLSCGSAVAVIPPLGRKDEPSGHIKDGTLAPMACGTGTAELAAAIAAQARKTGCSDVLVYVHGFNTLFDGALLRAGQLALDTSWACPVAMFSWASEGDVGRYIADIEHSGYAAPELEAFLRALDRQGLRADILGHSIGARLTLSALASSASHDEKPSAGFVRVLILAAADVGADSDNNDFVHLMDAAAPFVHHTTVYASRGDAVLAVSAIAHGDVPRAGHRPHGDLVLESGGKVDVIDCTDAPAELLGHSYFGMSYEALSDIALVLREVPTAARLIDDDGRPATLSRRRNPALHDVLKVAPGRRPDFWVRFIRTLAPLVPRIELAPLTGSPE
jgi:esterase/lipase superfamily enzyme